MAIAMFLKLDNPAWYSLTETHKHFALGNEEIKRYPENIAPFVAFHSDKKNILNQLDKWMNPGESFFIIGDLPALPSNFIIENSLVCTQMLCTENISLTTTSEIEKLDEADDEQMISLINLVLPGYYKPGTRLMGDYFGIRHNGELVAMTGERMCMDGLAEISAVVTHPDFTGRGYAQQLVAHTSNKNLAAGIIPFLHTGERNERAIKIYTHLGFKQRRIITFHRIKRMR
jgi:GNAT superfamily N-acetyltransferase